MQIIPLTIEERAGSGFTHKVIVTCADISAAATSKTLAIFPDSGNGPAGLAVQAAGFRVVTEFDGGATSALTLKVGDGGDDDRYIPATSIHVDGTPVDYWQTSAATSTLPYVYTAADTIDAVFTATGANTSALTQGEVHIFLKLANLNYF